jgi:hypothetical protein
MMSCVLGVGCLWPRGRVSLAELYLLRFCLDIVLQVCSLSPYVHEPCLRLASLGQSDILDR